MNQVVLEGKVTELYLSADRSSMGLIVECVDVNGKTTAVPITWSVGPYLIDFAVGDNVIAIGSVAVVVKTFPIKELRVHASVIVKAKEQSDG